MNWRILIVSVILSVSASVAGAERNLVSLCGRPWPIRAEAAIRSGEVMRTAPHAVEGWTTVYHLNRKQVRGTWPAGATFFGREENDLFIARVFVGMNRSDSSRPGCGNPSGACWRLPVAKRPVPPPVVARPIPSAPPVINVFVEETTVTEAPPPPVVARVIPPPPPPLSFGSGGGLALPASIIPIGSLVTSRNQAHVGLFFGWQRKRPTPVCQAVPVTPGTTCPPVTPATQPTPPAPGSAVIETPNPQAGLGWVGAPVAPNAPLPAYPPPLIGGPGSVSPLPPTGG